MDSSPHLKTHLRVKLLDALYIELDHLSIRLPTRKTESLLAYLILHPDIHAREKLAALFWGDSPQADARASLRQALSTLRHKIDKKLIIADRESVQIDPAFPIWVDAISFKKLAGQFLSEPTFSAQPFDHNLYPGDLLSNFYDDWIFSLREYYHTLYIDVMSRSIEILRAQSDYPHAIDYAKRILGIEAANERAHQHLMFCYITMGERNKALHQYDACKQALKDELDVEPAPDTQALFHWIKEDVSRIPSRAAKITNLPIPISSFMGRQIELTQIKDLLAKMRLVTLTGVGGSGKTRLAIHAATDLIDTYRDGVWWVELASVSKPSLVPHSVARALGLQIETQKPVIESLKQFLQNRQVLLVLDNCEHLLDACASLADSLLNACKDLKILATSREALGVMGEQVWLAPTLSTPKKEEINLADLAMRFEAVQLFVERTREVSSDFVLSESDALAVVQICQRLDGIPLAIELAAARMKMLSAGQIAVRLDNQFGLLTTGPRTVEVRHRTLRATVDWSYDLLSEDEQLLFSRLSIFSGGWTIESAEAVCSGKELEAHKVLDLISHLVDKSLISVGESGERYTMLETMKAYGREKLAEKGEENWIQRQFLEYFLEEAETADEKIRGPEQLVWLEKLNTERNNFNSAVERSLSHPDTMKKGIQMVCALAYYWGLVGDINTSRFWLQKAYSASEALGRTATRANILFNRGYWSTFTLFDLSPSERQVMLEISLEIWNELGAEYAAEKAKCLLALGYIRKQSFFDDRGLELLSKSAEIFRIENQAWWQAWALTLSIDTDTDAPSQDLLRRIEEEAVLWRKTGNRTGLAFYHWDLGDLAMNQRDYIEAERQYLESLALFEEVSSRGFIMIISRNLASVKRGLKQYEQAEMYYKKCIPYVEAAGGDFRDSIINLGMGYISLRKNDPTRAEKYLSQSLKVSLELDIKDRILLSIAGFAALAVLRKNPALAARLFGAYSAHWAMYREQPKSGVYSCPITLQDIEFFLKLNREQMNSEAFERAWTAGYALSLDDMVEEVLSRIPHSQ